MTLTLDRDFLEELHERYHRLGNLAPDPLLFARGYDSPEDGEVAGLIAASLAYGRVEKIVEALTFVFSKLGPRPRAALLGAGPTGLSRMFEGFAYRFNKGPDVAVFLWLLAQALERNGSLRAIFARSYSGSIESAMTAFCAEVLEGDPRPLLDGPKVPRGNPARYLLSSPGSGSAAKRLCLYLRWMVRRDELDPGYWEGAAPTCALVVPLDTHVAKVGRLFSLTSRKSADWKTAVEITESIRRFEPLDPLRYDFSLFRYGMGRLDDRIDPK